jgi:diaminohydroxyphosphoribosylaminopyrimidine deaminase/5-amino-6-(5-phosphoribosylamino)uracil reductase
VTLVPTLKRQREEDEAWMRRALEWSRMGRGLASPRPSVGCVLVRGGEVLGGGHTQPGDGTPHAETFALEEAKRAGRDVRGATAYVTLEPCSHWGTTPPCADALVRAGIARVVCGVGDPDPRVAGRGFRRLRAARVAVTAGVLARECFRAMDDFLISVARQSPFVSLKMAASLDGRIALRSGESRWISGEESRRHVHALRFEADATLVGVETVLADDPSLSVRGQNRDKTRPLVRVILDSHARTPLTSTCVRTAREIPTLIAVTPRASASTCRALEAAGAQVLTCAAGASGQVEWRGLLGELWRRKITGVMIEGGARVAGSALQDQAVDRVDWFCAPVLLGEGRSAVQGFEVEALRQAPRLHHVAHEVLGGDILISGYTREHVLEPLAE